MKGTPRLPAFAVLFVLMFFGTTPASSQWNMGNSLKELIMKHTGQVMQNHEKESQAAEQLPNRFKDNGDGTLTDSRTGLIWLKNASCGNFFEGDQNGNRNSRAWPEAKSAASRLSSGFCDLSDGSKEGDWRLPSREELLAIAHDVSKKEKWQAGEAFSGIQSVYYWSSTKGDLYQDYAFYVSMMYGIDSYAFQLNTFHVLPVRGGQKAQPK